MFYFCFCGYICAHAYHLLNCWVANAETWGNIRLFLFCLLLHCAFSESDITQESPFTSADTGNSRSAFPSYTGISTEGSSDFSWGYGVSCMLLVWWSTWETFWEFGFVCVVSIFHSFTLLHCFFTFYYLNLSHFISYKEASVFTLSVFALSYSS